jgi:two-component system OmpR family response regulator
VAGIVSTRSGKTVIGVDDQPENLAILEGIIESRGYSFFGASSGAECISLALRVDPKLILLDVQMPEMDGYETCRRLRGMFLLKTVPVAFLTARNGPDDVREGLAAGGNDFIVKPFDPVRLLARVEHWMTRRVT